MARIDKTCVAALASCGSRIENKGNPRTAYGRLAKISSALRFAIGHPVSSSASNTSTPLHRGTIVNSYYCWNHVHNYFGVYFRMEGIWRPFLPDSIDGKPLVTTVDHLLIPFQFPYDRLPRGNRLPFWNIASWFLRPEIVLLTITFYLLSKPLFAKLRTVLLLDQSPQPRWFRVFLLFHNAGLAIFSAICAFHTWIITWGHLKSYGLFAAYCDLDGTYWRESNFGAWACIFYLSKYYEFVDTWILVLKGKDASFLQVYHHTGIAFIMWCAVASQSSWLLFVVLLNSVIHTLMYTYFCIKTISPKTEIKAAKYLTMAQIGQFLTGIACTLPIFFLGSTCASSSSRFALACLHTYGIGLIALFVTFAQKKYKKDV